jgi:hypothetical protein
MPNYSALHYAAKAEKANLLAQEAAEKAKEYSEAIDPSSYVDLSSKQTVSGDKDFIGKLTVNGKDIAVGATSTITYWE